MNVEVNLEYHRRSSRMENHIGTDSGAMFELSVFKNRTPPDEVAFLILFKDSGLLLNC